MKGKTYFGKVVFFCLIFLAPLSLLLGDSPPPQPPEEETDAVVLGGGIGGLTAAIYLARAGAKPIVIEGIEPGGQITQSPGIQNWPGELEIPGNLLTEKTRKQAEESGARFLEEEVIRVDFSTSPFTIVARDPWLPGHQRTIRAKTCIIATGAVPNKLSVKGESEFFSRGVHTCATCDGALYKGRPVAVVGGGDGAIVEAYHLAKLASKVTLILRGPALKSIEEKRKENLLALPNVEVLFNTKIQEVVGNEKQMTGLILVNSATKEERTLPADALFLAIGTKPNTGLFAKQIELDSRGYIVLKKDQSTSKSGVFALGDVSDPIYRQAITAAGDGAKAALQVESYLAGTKALAAPQPRPFQSIKNSALALGQREVSILQIKSAEQFKREVLESTIPVIVDFYADWCGPCRTLGPHIEAWSQQFKGKIKFAKVNIDHFQKLAQRYRITSLPTILYFGPGGQLNEIRTGNQEIAALMQSLDESLKKD